MTDREKLVDLICGAKINGFKVEDLFYRDFAADIADHLIANNVTIHKHGLKAKSEISKTGFMCSVCYSDFDPDAVFCKYCGAKIQPKSKENRP